MCFFLSSRNKLPLQRIQQVYVFSYFIVMTFIAHLVICLYSKRITKNTFHIFTDRRFCMHRMPQFEKQTHIATCVHLAHIISPSSSTSSLTSSFHVQCTHMRAGKILNTTTEKKKIKSGVGTREKRITKRIIWNLKFVDVRLALSLTPCYRIYYAVLQQTYVFD